MRTGTGRLVCTGRSYLSIVGYTSNITYVLKLSDFLLRKVIGSKPIDYFLTYKLSQDHLEMLFACIRRGLGCSNNPSATEFESVFKKLLYRSGVSLLPCDNASVTKQDDTALVIV